jgi:oxygen-independent coproporphyrinogen-3 oxidase
MDHFALADDELAQAQRDGTLHRNFQGYSTHSDSDLVALGVSAISSMPDGFSQNHSNLDSYYADLDVPRLPIARGVALDADDHLRGEVIQQLICNNTLDKRRIESQFDIEFDRYFAAELAQLAGMHADELVELGEQRLDVTARGRLLIRNICRVFDRYRVDKEEKFSKMI